jgi:hypothetical protein
MQKVFSSSEISETTLVRETGAAMTDTAASSMVNQPNANAPLPRAVTVARIWLLVLGCAWFLAGP